MTRNHTREACARALPKALSLAYGRSSRGAHALAMAGLSLALSVEEPSLCEGPRVLLALLVSSLSLVRARESISLPPFYLSLSLSRSLSLVQHRVHGVAEGAERRRELLPPNVGDRRRTLPAPAHSRVSEHRPSNVAHPLSRIHPRVSEPHSVSPGDTRRTLARRQGRGDRGERGGRSAGPGPERGAVVGERRRGPPRRRRTVARRSRDRDAIDTAAMPTRIREGGGRTDSDTGGGGGGGGGVPWRCRLGSGSPAGWPAAACAGGGAGQRAGREGAG